MPLAPKRRHSELDMTVKAVDLKHFGRQGSKLVTEASNLARTAEGTPWLQRVYSDACDQGICIRGQHRFIRFFLSEVIYNGHGEDREVGGWKFKALDTDQPITEVVIFWD